MSSNQVQRVRTGIFIDGSNLFWASKSKDANGDRINYLVDFAKLKKFLKKRYSPVFYNYYACEDNAPAREPYITRAADRKKYHLKLEGYGYNVIRKDLKHIKTVTKCDTDVEIVMAMHKLSNDFDNIVLFSGDCDFLAAIQEFHSQGKYIRIYCFKNFLSWELKEFAIKHPRCNFILLDNLRQELEYIPKTPGPKPTV